MSGQDNQKGQNSHYGDVINQSGTFLIGVDKRVMGDKIETQINNSQDLVQAAKEIQNLLNQLSLDYPSDTPRVLGAKAVDTVEKSPQLKDRFIRGIKAGSFAALEKLIDHPVAKFFIEGAKEVLKP
jgi:internalin A